MVKNRPESVNHERSTRLGRLADFLGLERNVAAVSGVVFLLGMGEELWKKFLPKYLEALGAGPAIVGLFGTAKDFFDAIYQYPGGWLADRFGRRRSFLVFVTLACTGYLIYLLSASWPVVFLGLAFEMSWSSMASPATFAVIGDALPPEKRAMGFTMQAILKRVPRTVAPLIGGTMIASLGILAGMRAGLAITILLGAVTALIVARIDVPIAVGAPVSIRGLWASLDAALKKLLVSDIIIRTCEGLSEVLIILYVTDVTGISIAQYGLLVAIQMATSILVYIPAARLADRLGRKPFVIATFACFALFPVAVVLARGLGGLVPAFMIGGLREIGEPSRKAMIVDFAEEHSRARTVGLYYLVRSLSITPAAAIGGLLWTIAPRTPFLVAGAVGMVGTVVFALTVEERYAA